MDDFDLIVRLVIGVGVAALIWALHYPLRKLSINGETLENRLIVYEVRWKWPKWPRAIFGILWFAINLMYGILLLIIWVKFTEYFSDFILGRIQSP